MHFDKDVILSAGRGRELEILREVAGIPAEYLDGKHHPCPQCGGKDRFRLVDMEAGAVYCNQCFNEHNGDYIAAAQWARNCSFDEALSLIGEFLGLTATGTHPAKKGASQPPGRDSAKPAAVFYYPDADGNPAYKVERYEYTKDGKRIKDFSQCSYINGKWVRGLVDTPGATIPTPKRIPFPYNLSRLMGSEVKTLFIVEGEKCADRLQTVLDSVEQSEQYAVSTLAGGSKTMKFWNDHADKLQGLNVFIIPDNDKPGRDGASAAVEGLSDNGVEVMVIPFDVKPGKYDVADWIDELRAADISDKEIGEEFLNTFPARGRDGIDWVDGLAESESEGEPDFLEYLPWYVKDYCEQVGAGFGVSGAVPAYIALSVASVAMAHRTVFTHGRYSATSALLHSMIVMPSGSGKSPIIDDFMLFPLREEDNRLHEQYEKRCEEYRGLPKKEQKTLEKPRFIRRIIELPTIEAVLQSFDMMEKAYRQEGIPKMGLCLFYDEGKLLIEGLDAYKPKAKQDLSILLSLMNGRGSGALRVDINSDRFFKDPRLILIAGVQNRVIKRSVKGHPEFFDEGFFQRVNMIVPKLRPCEHKALEDDSSFNEMRDAYGLKIRDIIQKRYYHRFYILDRDARRKYAEYEHDIEAQTNGIKSQDVENWSQADEVKLSFLQKSKQRVLEVALVLQVFYDVADEKHIDDTNDTKGKITAKAIEGAVKFVRYAQKEFENVFALSEVDRGQDLDSRIIQDMIAAGAKGITRRDLQRNYFNSAKVELVNDFMVRLMKQNPKIKQKAERRSVVYYHT